MAITIKAILPTSKRCQHIRFEFSDSITNEIQTLIIHRDDLKEKRTLADSSIGLIAHIKNIVTDDMTLMEIKTVVEAKEISKI